MVARSRAASTFLETVKSDDRGLPGSTKRLCRGVEPVGLQFDRLSGMTASNWGNFEPQRRECAADGSNLDPGKLQIGAPGTAEGTSLPRSYCVSADGLGAIEAAGEGATDGAGEPVAPEGAGLPLGPGLPLAPGLPDGATIGAVGCGVRWGVKAPPFPKAIA